jgi:hypothetical protein
VRSSGGSPTGAPDELTSLAASVARALRACGQPVPAVARVEVTVVGGAPELRFLEPLLGADASRCARTELRSVLSDSTADTLRGTTTLTLPQ